MSWLLDERKSHHRLHPGAMMDILNPTTHEFGWVDDPEMEPAPVVFAQHLLGTAKLAEPQERQRKRPVSFSKRSGREIHRAAALHPRTDDPRVARTFWPAPRSAICTGPKREKAAVNRGFSLLDFPKENWSG